MQQIIRIVAHRNRNGSLSIRQRVTLAGCQTDISCGVTIAPEHWDSRHQRVAPSHRDARALNEQIDNTADLLRALIANNPTATPSQLRASVRQTGNTTLRDNDDFFEIYDLYVATQCRRNNWSDGTQRNYASLRTLLLQHNPLLKLSTLDAATLDKFISSLFAKGRNNTTIARLLRRLRSFIKWCCEQGFVESNLHNSYRPRLTGAHFETKQVIYLTTDELNAVERAEIPSYLAISRDIFVFCSYTGLRISDALRLRNIDIANNAVSIVTRKTADSLRVELNKHSAAIVARYYRPNLPSEPLFSSAYSPQTLNVHLRAIGQICHIDTPIHLVHYSGSQRIDEIKPKWQLMTSHVARRTFVVHALQLGIPAEVITRWTGHSSLEAMRPYMAIVDTLKAESMAKFNDI